MVCLESLIKIMSLISCRCLFVLVLILAPFPTGSDGTDGFPKLDDKDKLKAAVEKLRKEDVLLDFYRVEHGVSVEAVIRCLDENDCFAADLIKNEVRLRNGYKTLGEGCSADPALNRHLFSPPSIRDLVKYPIWQRHLLDANQPLCSPFKHLQCSKTTAKCECRPGLIWREEPFEIHLIPSEADRTLTGDPLGLREREKICIFAMNKPCQMREYPGDEEIDPKALSPKQIAEGMPIAEYFDIFLRADVSGDLTRGIQSLKIQPPSCGDNECSQSLYGQRQRVCAPRDWDREIIFFSLEYSYPPNNLRFRFGPFPEPLYLGRDCILESHRRLFTISDEELSDSDFWANRKKKLEDIKEFKGNFESGREGFCDLMDLITCSPAKDLHKFVGECQCMHPFVRSFTPSRNPNFDPPPCELPEEPKKCDMTNGIIKLLRNETYARGTKLLLNKGLAFSMIGVCQENFKCHTGLDIDDEMEIYCTCENGQAGPQCLDKLTGFLIFARVPSFPSDGKDIEEKWKIFNEFNEKAIQFEKIFNRSEGKSCDLNAEAETSTAAEKIRRLDKKGTSMTKAQYKKLADTLIKLTKQHQNGPGLCHPSMACNSVHRTCVKKDEKIMLEACQHLADICELEGMVVLNGKCFCAPKFERSTQKKSTKSLGVVKRAPDYFIIVGIVILAMK